MLYVMVTYVIKRIKKEKTVSASVRIHNAQTTAQSIEFFSVRQIQHFCQYCVKYLLQIIVRTEKC